MRFRRVFLLVVPGSLLLLPLVAFPASGSSQILWASTWGGVGNDYAGGLAVDAYGNIYTTGSTNSFGPGSPTYHIAVSLLKYDPAGNLVWQKIWSGSGSGSDEGDSIAVDSLGNVYVTGSTTSFGTGYSVLILKFNSSGNLLWQRIWGDGGNNYGNSVAVDSSGNIYVTGNAFSFTDGARVYLLKFDSTGNLLWQRLWGGSYGRGVAVDSSGNIYVTGATSGYYGNHILLLKYNSTGDFMWGANWSGSNLEVGTGISVDSSGNIYVTGYTSSFGPGSHVFLLKFGSTGALIWQVTCCISGGTNFVASVAVDRSGDSFVTGSAASLGVSTNGVPLLKFDASGVLLWQLTYGGGRDDVGAGVAVDAYGDPVVTGSVNESGPYTLGFANFTVGTAAFTRSNFSGLNEQGFTPQTPQGTVETPSGSQSYAGRFDEFLFKSSSSPGIAFIVNPTLGGSIGYNGTTYETGQNAAYANGTVAISSHPFIGYQFTGWSTMGGVSVASPSTNSTTATITGPGTLAANFTKLSSTSITPLTVLSSILVTTIFLIIRKR